MVYEGNKVTWALKEVAPYLVVSRARLRRYNFRQGLPLFLEGCDPVADLNQNVSEENEIGFAADSSVPGDDNRFVSGFCDVHLCSAYLTVDAAARPVVDEGIITVPEGISGVENVGLNEVD